MADSIDARPVVRCLIARPLQNGGIGKSRIVRLSTAFLAMKAGFHVVGPDPDDMAALEAWEREHSGPFNPPRECHESE
jgi:hypothetical protein